MSGAPHASPDCGHARLHIGGEPGSLPPDVVVHLASCAGCRRFRDETAMLDGRLRAALELPLNRFASRAAAASAPRRRFLAMAASVGGALLLAGGAWLLRPQQALADEVLAHVRHEAFSWDLRERVSTDAVMDVLKLAGIEFDSSMRVTYASSCPFRGRRVPHLVVQTRDGPMTVLLLAGEKVPARRAFAAEGLRGVLLPAGEGSVAVLLRGPGAAPDALAADVVSAVRWR